MTRGVEQGDDPDALFGRIGEDFVHLAFGQLAGRGGGIVGVPFLDLAFHGVAFIRSAVDRDGHIVGQEAQAVVAERQLDVGV